MNHDTHIKPPHEQAERNARAYDRIAHCYDAQVASTVREVEVTALIRLLRREFGPLHDKKVLDLGCGTGLVPDVMRVHPDRYLGVDPSVGMLNRARRKHPQLVFRQGWQEDTGADEGYFDVVLSLFGVLSYSPLPEAAAAEIGRVLRPGGGYAVMAMGMPFARRPKEEPCAALGIESTFTGYTRARLKALFAPLGPVRVVSLSLKPMVASVTTLLPPGLAARIMALESTLLGPLHSGRFRYHIALGRRT